jgi:hypothetical protein
MAPALSHRCQWRLSGKQSGTTMDRVVSARSPLWNAAVEVADFEAADSGLLDDPRTSSFRSRAVRRARKL